MQEKSQQAQYTTTSSTSMAHLWWSGSRRCSVESRYSKPTTHLSSTYTSEPPVALRVQGLMNFLASAAAAEKEENGWLNLVKAAIEKQAVDYWISWSAYTQTLIMRSFHLQQSMPLCLCSPKAFIRQPCYVTPWISPKKQSSA